MIVHKYGQLLQYIRDCVIDGNRLATMVVPDQTTVVIFLHPDRQVALMDLVFLRSVFMADDVRVTAGLAGYENESTCLRIDITGIKITIEN